MPHVPPDQCAHQGTILVVVRRLTSVVGIVGLGALGQAHAATAVASATVIAPVNIPASLADLPVAVSTFGGWIRVVIPLAQGPSPVSSASLGGRSAGAAVASPVVKDASLTPENFKQLAAGDGMVQGDTVSALSLRAPKTDVAGGGRYRVTVAFN